MAIGRGYASNGGFSRSRRTSGSAHHGGTGMHPYHGKGFANPYNPNASKDKLAAAMKKLKRLMEAGRIQPGDSIPGSYLNQTCGIYSQYQQDLFVAKSGLEYDRRTDMYRVPGGDEELAELERQQRRSLGTRLGDWAERNADR